MEYAETYRHRLPSDPLLYVLQALVHELESAQGYNPRCEKRFDPPMWTLISQITAEWALSDAATVTSSRV